ncbi:hypothetical protein E4N95_10935 [Treponema denticola]|uniref:hypothetical protein n=1 Tax=Treponema denticola TaxID=158 RepID=UPI003D8B09E7
MFILFRQDPFYNGLMGLRVYFDGSGGIGNGSAGSAKQKALRRNSGTGLIFSTNRNGRKRFF